MSRVEGVKAGGGRQARAGVDAWVEESLSSCNIKLPKHHHLTADELQKPLAEMTTRAWVSRAAFDPRDATISVIGETKAVAKCMHELVSWLFDVGLDVLTKMTPVKTSLRIKSSKRGSKNTRDSDDSG